MIEVLKQALDALENIMLMRDLDSATTIAKNARYGLRQAIVDLESQEPVAPRCMGTNCRMPNADSHSPECIWETAQSQGWSNAPEAIEARQAIAEAEKQEPVALTDDEILDAAFSAYCRGENTRELFRIMRSSRLTCSIGWDRDELKAFARNIEALCTHPPQRTWVGLTDEDIWDVFGGRIGTSNSDVNPIRLLADARKLEAKLKEKNT
jgi:hypothetical protein